MSMEGLRAVTDPVEGAWITPRLVGAFGAVSRTVPSGFEAYARVLHPVEHSPHEPVRTWAEVCERTGRTAHALMQWWAITTPVAGTDLPTRGGRWDAGIAEVGNLQPGALAALIEVLEPATGDQDCFFALWEGFGWRPGEHDVIVSVAGTEKPAAAVSTRPAIPEQLAQALAAPRLRLPSRDHLLLRGPLPAASRIGHQVTGDWLLGQSPSLMWPVDRSWCVASEIDFDSTLVAGSSELVAAVLAAPGLEAWPVTESGDLSWHGDTVNG